METQAANRGDAVAVSALDGSGMEDLLGLIDQRLGATRRAADLAVPLAAGAAPAWLHPPSEMSHDNVRLLRSDRT